MVVWFCLASRQNVIKRTPGPVGSEREGEGSWREAREGGVHRYHQNVIKRTSAPAGRKRKIGKKGDEGRRRAPSQVKCRHVHLTTARASNSLFQAMVMLCGTRDLIHKYML